MGDPGDQTLTVNQLGAPSVCATTQGAWAKVSTLGV
jgi:hypothetical protein